MFQISALTRGRLLGVSRSSQDDYVFSNFSFSFSPVIFPIVIFVTTLNGQLICNWGSQFLFVFVVLFNFPCGFRFGAPHTFRSFAVVSAEPLTVHLHHHFHDRRFEAVFCPFSFPVFTFFFCVFLSSLSESENISPSESDVSLLDLCVLFDRRAPAIDVRANCFKIRSFCLFISIQSWIGISTF